MTVAGRVMLPVPRTALPSMFSMQIETAPLNATLEQASAADSTSPRPPIQWNTHGAPISMVVVNSTASASASTKEWWTSASARSRRPAPSARAIADDTPPPTPPLAAC
jgi:hypothetical protein